MTRSEILQMVQDVIDSGATVSIMDGKFIITYPDGTVKILDEAPTEGSDVVLSGGASHYDDDMGDVIDLLDAQGVIPPVEMSFSVPELENVLVEEVEEANAPATSSVPVDDGGEGGDDSEPGPDCNNEAEFAEVITGVPENGKGVHLNGSNSHNGDIGVLIIGTDFDDHLNGNNYDDFIIGGDGDDVIHGNNGNDCLEGNEGNDTLDGGKGNDHIDGGIGSDKLRGGEGSDTFVYNSILDAGDVIEDWNIGGDDDTLDLDGLFDDLGVDSADRSERIEIESFGAPGNPDAHVNIDTNGDGTFDLTLVTIEHGFNDLDINDFIVDAS